MMRSLRGKREGGVSKGKREKAVSFLRSILMLFTSSSQRSVAYEASRKCISEVDSTTSTRLDQFIERVRSKGSSV